MTRKDVNEGTRRRDRRVLLESELQRYLVLLQKEVMQLLRPRVGVDILVYTPEEFEELSRKRSFFQDEIIRE